MEKFKQNLYCFNYGSQIEKNKGSKSLLLAAKIADALEEKGLNKSAFAQLMGVQPSVVTKWLSGSHNFTIETLFDIELKLDIDLFAIPNEQKEMSIKMHTTTQSNVPVSMHNINVELIDLTQSPHVSYLNKKPLSFA